MVLIVGFVIIGVIYAVIAWADSSDGVGSKMFLGTLGAAIGLCIGLVLSVMCTLFAPVHNRTASVYKLQTLNDNRAIEGDIFLGVGSIKGNMYYTFYKETDYGYVLQEIRAHKAYIRYSDNPRVELVEFGIGEGAWQWLVLPGVIDEYHYIIYVPEGTISNKHELDAE